MLGRKAPSVSRIKLSGPKSMASDIVKGDAKEPEKNAWVHFSLEGSQSFHASISNTGHTDTSTSSSENYEKSAVPGSLVAPGDLSEDSSESSCSAVVPPTAINKVCVTRRDLPKSSNTEELADFDDSKIGRAHV